VGSGALVRPGDLLVLTLPNHERDIDTSTARPTISVTGDAATRVVALSGTGEVLTDSTTPGGTITIPQYTALIALLCTGGSGAVAAGLAGWTASDRLPYVGSGVSLASRAVVTGLAAPDRSFRSASAATANAAGPAASASAVKTWLPSDTSTVVVSIDATEDADISALALGLTGAIRAAAADGGEQAPTVVTAGGRAHLLYAVEPDPASSAGTDIEVSVVTGNTWRLAGVLGGTADVAITATAIASQGASAVVAPMVQASTGNATVRWAAPSSPQPTGTLGPQGGTS
jgi:hypothetical protein